LLFLLGFGYFGDADVEVRVSERGREWWRRRRRRRRRRSWG